MGLLLALGLVTVSFSGYFGLDRLPVLAQVTAFRTQWAMVAAVVALVLGWWFRAAVIPLVLVVLASGALLLPRVTSEAVTPGGARLTVFSANVRFDGADPSSLADAIRTSGADVVALPEASRSYAAGLAERLRRAGQDYVVGGDSPVREDSVNTSILVRASLSPAFTESPAGLSNSAVTATLRLGTRTVTVQAVHPSSPVPGGEHAWHRDLELLRPGCRRQQPTVLLGDFNATLDHSGLRDLLDAGCTDAAQSTGHGLVGTWPQRAPRWLGATIDHVLAAGGVSAVSYGVVDDPGSDHRAVTAVLTVD